MASSVREAECGSRPPADGRADAGAVTALPSVNRRAEAGVEVAFVAATPVAKRTEEEGRSSSGWGDMLGRVWDMKIFLLDEKKKRHSVPDHSSSSPLFSRARRVCTRPSPASHPMRATLVSSTPAATRSLRAASSNAVPRPPGARLARASPRRRLPHAPSAAGLDAALAGAPPEAVAAIVAGA